MKTEGGPQEKKRKEKKSTKLQPLKDLADLSTPIENPAVETPPAPKETILPTTETEEKEVGGRVEELPDGTIKEYRKDGTLGRQAKNGIEIYFDSTGTIPEIRIYEREGITQFLNTKGEVVSCRDSKFQEFPISLNINQLGINLTPEKRKYKRVDNNANPDNPTIDFLYNKEKGNMFERHHVKHGSVDIFNRNGKVAKRLDIDGTRECYNEQGMLIEQTNVKGNTKFFDENGNLTKIIDKNGKIKFLEKKKKKNKTPVNTESAPVSPEPAPAHTLDAPKAPEPVLVTEKPDEQKQKPTIKLDLNDDSLVIKEGVREYYDKKGKLKYKFFPDGHSENYDETGKMTKGVGATVRIVLPPKPTSKETTIPGLKETIKIDLPLEPKETPETSESTPTPEPVSTIYTQSSEQAKKEEEIRQRIRKNQEKAKELRKKIAKLREKPAETQKQNEPTLAELESELDLKQKELEKTPKWRFIKQFLLEEKIMDLRSKILEMRYKK